MIKFENTNVLNFDNAIRGMRNPLESWAKSDSEFKIINKDDVAYGYGPIREFVLGEKDVELMRKLVKAGSDHRKFLRQIIVSVDITAPLYWWKEFDTYKVGTVENSCSTMHTIHKKPFRLADFSCEYLDDVWLESLKATIKLLNDARDGYIAASKETKPLVSPKDYWYQMIQLLPSSYNQLRTVTLNYEVLLNQYHARKDHKLQEWRDYCDFIEMLPYFKEICL